MHRPVQSVFRGIGGLLYLLVCCSISSAETPKVTAEALLKTLDDAEFPAVQMSTDILQAQDGTYLGVVTYGEHLEHMAVVGLRHTQEGESRWIYPFERPVDVKSRARKTTHLMHCNVMGSSPVRPTLTLSLKDVDGDQKQEAILEVKTCTIHRALGPVDEKVLRIFNVNPPPKTSLRVVLDESHPSYTKTATHGFMDTNQDTHPDLVVESTETWKPSAIPDGDKGSVHTRRDVYLYDPQLDTFIFSPKDSTAPR